jgi:hypothetical protein
MLCGIYLRRKWKGNKSDRKRNVFSIPSRTTCKLKEKCKCSKDVGKERKKYEGIYMMEGKKK